MAVAGVSSERVVVSILVPYVRVSWIDRCLSAVRATLPEAVRCEVLALANGEAAMAHTPEPFPELVQLSSRVNLGFGGGCNWMARHARGEFLVLLNDDTEVCAGWLDVALQAMRDDDTAGAVGCTLLTPDGHVEECGRVLWRDGATTGIGAGRPQRAAERALVREVDTCSACGLVMRRSAWDAVGGFDERFYPAYYEDVDLALAMRRRGWRILSAAGARVQHRGSASTSPLWRRFLGLRNHGLFTAKWAATLPLFAERPRDEPRPADVERTLQAVETRTRQIYHQPGMPRDDAERDEFSSTRAEPPPDHALLQTELDHARAELALKDEYIAFLQQNLPALEGALRRQLAAERRRTQRREALRTLPLVGPALAATVRAARQRWRR